MRIAILGAGMIGAAIAYDFLKEKDIKLKIVDANKNSLEQIVKNSNIELLQLNLNQYEAISEAIFDSDLVINALPGFMGFNTLKSIIKLGKNVVDISFAPEDCMQLDRLAKDNNVLAVFDAGVAPGMSNILVSRGYNLLENVESAKIYVGGLPFLRHWPYEYKAGFSPIDVIEEYTRPAFYIQDGKLVKKEALSEIEYIDFDEVGTLEAFNTDGLRSLLKTMNIPNMVEKTLRYPGHAEKMKMFKNSGFFSRKAISINGENIRPIDLTSKLLFSEWKLKKGEADMTLMRVNVVGKKLKKEISYECTLHDVYDPLTGIHSMARTTGYTATMIARLIINNKIKDKGVIPPEVIGKNKEFVEFIFKGFQERGIFYKEKVFS